MEPLLKIRDIGEAGLLQYIQRFCPPAMIGDDGAVLSINPGHDLVVTTDVLVDGVHFSDRTTPPAAVGWRAATANLSDLAAMGAIPKGVTVGLSVPGELEVRWVEELYSGIVRCLQPFDTVIVGGDICRSSVITVAITAFGTVLPGQVLRRTAAQYGDVIMVTGVHGASRAGLELLLHPSQGEGIPSIDRRKWIKAHQYPHPRLDVVPHLWHRLNKKPSQRQVGGMDSSDGLADAIIQICEASGVGANLYWDCLPIPTGLKEWIGTEQAEQWTLYGGEDFELVLCLPLPVAEQLIDDLGAEAKIIGEITTERTVKLVSTAKEEELHRQNSFQHFDQRISP